MSQYSTDTVWVGMEVHQDSITAVILFGDRHEPQIERLPGDLNAVRRMFRRLSEYGTPRSCYEASGAGYVLQRCLEHDGFHCVVIAPSLVPKKPGDRRKTDRLDAIHLDEQYRSGHLTPVTVPTREQEEIRQLVRSRLAVQSHVVRLKHRIVRVLATHGHRFTAGKSNWTQKHRNWLRKLNRELEGPLQTVLAHHLEHLEYLEGQRNSLEAEIDRYAQSEPFRRQVEALCGFRGVKTLTATTILTELGDIRRFARPTGLMALAGLVLVSAAAATCNAGDRSPSPVPRNSGGSWSRHLGTIARRHRVPWCSIAGAWARTRRWWRSR